MATVYIYACTSNHAVHAQVAATGAVSDREVREVLQHIERSLEYVADGERIERDLHRQRYPQYHFTFRDAYGLNGNATYRCWPVATAERPHDA